MTGALDGLRVVSLGWGYAGTLVSLVLADYGAEVLRVEPPGGDVLRREPAFPLWGRGQQSVVLDLHTEADRLAARRLAEGADIVLTTFRPGVAERLGLGYDELAAENPGLVHVSITGFGTRGPYARMKGYEPIVLAKLGAMAHVAGMAPRPGPAFPAVPFASFSAAQTALLGTFAALHVRGQTGLGQRVETSLVQGLAAHDPWEWFLHILCAKYPGAYTPARAFSESGVPNSGFAFRLLVCLTRDGCWLQFSQSSPHLFREFIEVLGLAWIWDDARFKTAPDFDTEEERLRFWELLLEAARQRTLAEWEEVFRAHPNVWAEPFRTTRELLVHAQMRHNDHVVVVDDPAVGRTVQLAPFAVMSGTPARAPEPAPALGAHTEASRGERRMATVLPARPAPTRPPFAGVTVLEFGLWYAAPYGPALLADLGARVIKVEPLAGEPMRHIMPVPDAGAVKSLQGKESLALDLEQPEAREIVRRLARQTDLVLMSYRGGVARRLGVDYASLREENPRLVYLNAPGYGTDGPCARRPAYAPTIGVAVGVARLQAGPSVPHGRELALDEIKEASRRLTWAGQSPGNADGCPALGVATALALGLVARGRTGVGQEILTSMLCTTAYAVSDDAIDYPDRPPRAEPDPMLYGMSALYRLYETSAGWIFLACPQEREWPALCRALTTEVELAADPRFVTPAARRANDAALAAILSEVFRRRAALAWERALAEHDVACAELAPAPIAEHVMNDATMGENGFLAEVEHPIFGPHRRLAPLVRLSRTPGEARPACTLGQHTRAVLSEVGYSVEAIEALAARGVIRLG